MKENTFYYFFIILTLFVFSCGEQEKTKKRSSRRVSITKEEIEQKKQGKVEALNDENVEERLLAYGKNNPETLVKVTTNFGEMKVRLYQETPLHRANFIRLVKNKFYDGTFFYRVEKDFVVQGGKSDDISRKNTLPNFGKYTVPAEIKFPQFFHKRGAIAMARDVDEKNPEKRSDKNDFYFVHGKTYTPAQTQNLGTLNQVNFPNNILQYYNNIGGNPNLDTQFTVFGEIVEGLEVLDKIANLEVSKDMFPKKDTYVEMVVIKE